MSLLCYNRGCGQRFDPENNTEGESGGGPGARSSAGSGGGLRGCASLSRPAGAGAVTVTPAHACGAGAAQRCHGCHGLAGPTLASLLRAAVGAAFAAVTSGFLF